MPLSVLAGGHDWASSALRAADLFWALGGGGGDFGVATGLRTRLHAFATVTSGTIAFGRQQARSVLRGWRDLMAAADDALDVMFGALHTPGGRLDAHALPGGWANLMARGDQRARDAYGINTGRLLAAKSQYDPDGVFTAIPLPE